MPEIDLNKPLHVISLLFPSTRNTLEELAFFNELSELASQGIVINLHLPSRRNTKVPSQLADICANIQFYPSRKVFSKQRDLPGLVAESAHPHLLKNILLDQAPILFWGLESSFFLMEPLLKFRQKIVRVSGDGLHVPTQLKVKISPLEWRLEVMRFGKFSKNLKLAQLVLTNHPRSYAGLLARFGNPVWYLPPFLGFELRGLETSKGLYTLFAGNFTRRNQVEFALFLIREVFAQIPYNLILASDRQFPEQLITEASYHYNVSLRVYKQPEELAQLIERSAIVCINKEESLIRLSALFKGGHLIASLDCSPVLIPDIHVHLLQSGLQAQALIQKLMGDRISEEELMQRQSVLSVRFNQAFNGMIFSSLIRSQKDFTTGISAFDS